MTVSLGEASLTLTEEDGEPLAHWSLPAVERVGRTPPLFAPHEDAGESLRIEDAAMVDAIERVRRAVRRRPAGPRVRRAVLLAAVAGLALLAWRTGPAPLYEHAAASLPDPVLANVDDALLARIETRAGAVCDAAPGTAALERLTEAILGPGRRAAILPDWRGAAELPGGLVIVGRDAVEGVDDPVAAAGWLLLGDMDPAPATRFLSESGAMATARLMTSGAAPEAAMEAHARRLLSAPVALDPEVLAARFDAAGLSATPLARARGDAVLAALDPYPTGGALPLGDADWIALRDICRP